MYIFINGSSYAITAVQQVQHNTTHGYTINSWMCGVWFVTVSTTNPAIIKEGIQFGVFEVADEGSSDSINNITLHRLKSPLRLRANSKKGIFKLYISISERIASRLCVGMSLIQLYSLVYCCATHGQKISFRVINLDDQRNPPWKVRLVREPLRRDTLDIFNEFQQTLPTLFKFVTSIISWKIQAQLETNHILSEEQDCWVVMRGWKE